MIGVLQHQRAEQAIGELLEAERHIDTVRDLVAVNDRIGRRQLATLGYKLSRIRRELEREIGR
jgi:hypothetical protein